MILYSFCSFCASCCVGGKYVGIGTLAEEWGGFSWIVSIEGTRLVDME